MQRRSTIKRTPKKKQWLLVYVTSVSVFWHCWIDFVLEWKMRKTNHGEQGSLIRQHCTISNLITKYVTQPWLLFVVADLIISKSSFLNVWACGAGAVCGSTKHTSLVFQPNLFSFSTDRYPQLLSSSQLSSPHQQAPLCCFIATRLSVPPSQTVFNISC